MTMDSIQYKRPSPWNSDSKAERQAEYLKRLTKLRADLIGQERSNLAHALERIRQSSSIATNSASKTLQPRPAASRRRPMLSTYEQFKLMRPVKQPVFIFPLQGHQLFESPRMTPPVRNERMESVNRHKKRVDETVKINLERMKHPLSNIPRMKKALKLNELILDTNDINISINSSEKYSYRTRGSRARTNSTESSMFGAFKTESLNKEHRQNYRRPSSYGGTPLPSIKPHGDGRQTFQTHLKVNTSPRSDLSSRTDLYDGILHPQTRSDCTARTDSHNRVLHPQTEPLPRIQKSSLKTGTNPGTHRQPKEEPSDSSTPGENVSRNTLGKGMEEQTEVKPVEETTKKYIRVDMPNIIYNCPTSDGDDKADDSGDQEISQIYKQNDIRQKELQSLLDDVRELNNRTDSLIYLDSKRFEKI